MFIRAQLSAQIATFVDFLISILLNQCANVYYVYATLIGSISGGLTNCAINYKWTFQTEDCSPIPVIIKYTLVWIGSIGLNLWGTYLLTEFLTLQNSFISINQSTAFIIAKVSVSIMVAILWNYNLHKTFVFKDAHINEKLKNKIKQITNQHGNKMNHYSLIGWAGGVILLSSLFDMMDGQVARIGGMSSTFGAMYDSVLDRYSELVTLGGICFCLIGHDYLLGAIITFAALVGSLMVSYVRARAEGLGLECKIGFMQRPERVVLTSLGLLICGIVATQNPDLSFDPMLILIVPMGFIAIFANITAFARIEYSRRQLMKK